MLSLNAINLYEEMLKYEFIWSSIKNSSLKKFKDLQVIQQDFTSQDAKEKIQDFLLNLDKKDFSILTEYNYQFVGGKIKCRKRKIKCRIFATNYLSFNLKLKL
ncbi:hypothetical protein SOQ66_000276 [Campylobacter coli]|nr:hypothetical protein [Campylobacter coli]